MEEAIKQTLNCVKLSNTKQIVIAGIFYFRYLQTTRLKVGEAWKQGIRIMISLLSYTQQYITICSLIDDVHSYPLLQWDNGWLFLTALLCQWHDVFSGTCLLPLKSLDLLRLWTNCGTLGGEVLLKGGAVTPWWVQLLLCILKLYWVVHICKGNNIWTTFLCHW